MKSMIAGILWLALSVPFAFADSTPVRLVAVQGEARVELEPNRAILTLEIRQSRKTLDEARQGVGTALKNTVAVLVRHGINEKQIEKTQVWQGPDYQWENNKQVLKGYQASMQLKVTLDDLSRLAALADDLAKVSDLALQGTSFTRSDLEALQAEQRRLALLNARQKAVEMLAVYDEKAGPVLTIRESASVMPVMYGRMEMKAMAMDAAAPEPGTWQKVTIEINVQVEFSIK